MFKIFWGIEVLKFKMLWLRLIARERKVRGFNAKTRLATRRRRVKHGDGGGEVWLGFEGEF